MKKPYTVTIGICAYNEENSIKELISKLLAQESKHFNLQRIILISDGSTDKTVENAKKINSNKIVIKEFKDRRGLATRLNVLFSLNQSDILIKIDADVLPANRRVIDFLVEEFNERVNLVSGNRVSKPINLIEKIHFVGDQIWYKVRVNIKNGENIHNHHGTLTAMKRDLIKTLNLPDNLYGIDDFVYLTNCINRGKFKFASKAVVLYKTPNNLSDYLKQHRRFIAAKGYLSKIFGDWILEEYHVPKHLIYKAILRELIFSPFHAPLYIILEMLTRASLKFRPYYPTQYGWEISKGTKGISSFSIK